MNIEEKVKAIAQGDEFSAYTYVFEDWETADHVIDRVPLPAIINVCPLQGQIERKNGRWRDMEYINIAFIDKVERDADGTENAAVYNRMKETGFAFINALNTSGWFERVPDTLPYSVIYEQLSSIVTGVLFTIELREVWHC